MTKDRIIAGIFSLVAFALFVVMDSISKFLADYCSVIQLFGVDIFLILFMVLFFFLKKKINFLKMSKFNYKIYISDLCDCINLYFSKI